MNPKLKAAIFWSVLVAAGVVPWLVIMLSPKQIERIPMGTAGFVATALCLVAGYVVLVLITRPNPKEKVAIGFLLIGAFCVWLIVLSRLG
jgi:hypothetical protein